MLEFHIRQEDGGERIARAAAPVTAGRSPGCGLQLRSWRVAREHARFVRGASGIVLEDLGSLTGTRVNGERVSAFGPLQPDDDIQIGPCLLRVRECPPPGGREDGHDSVCAPDMPRPPDAAPPEDPAGWDAPRPLVVAASVDPALRKRLHAALLDALDLRRRDVAGMSDGALRSEAEERLGELIAQDAGIAPDVDRQALLRQVVDEAVGLGPLEPLLSDDAVTEIMVNRHDEIYVEIAGRLRRHEISFSSEQAVLGVIERIVAPLGRRIDESSPMVDARLRDGSRVNAVIAPIALKGASLTIRKFARNRLRMADLVSRGSVGESMARFLALCVREKKNIVVSGGTGSGKTTLLNVLADHIPEGERIVTIEDAAELRLSHAHLVSLEARPPNLEGRGTVSIRDLIRNALRMRPDRIVVGECRGGEAFDMLAAMNTGHEGSLTTLHANTPRDALGRLETMILMAGMDLPLTAIREHVASSIDLIVQQARLADGRRRVTAVVEVAGIESGRIQLQELFRHDRASDGFAGAGMVPGFYDAWRAAGIPIEADWFTTVEASAASRLPEEAERNGSGRDGWGREARGWRAGALHDRAQEGLSLEGAGWEGRESSAGSGRFAGSGRVLARGEGGGSPDDDVSWRTAGVCATAASGTSLPSGAPPGQ